jgi:hypothetical protein
MTRLADKQTNDAAARKQHDAEQYQAEEELPALGKTTERELEKDEQHRASDGTEQPAGAAEDDKDDQFAGHLPGDHRRADEAVQIRVERTGDTGDHAGQDEGSEPDLERLDAERGEADIVLPRRL